MVIIQEVHSDVILYSLPGTRGGIPISNGLVGKREYSTTVCGVN